MFNEQNGQQRLHSAGELQAKPEADKEWGCGDTWGGRGQGVSKERVQQASGRRWAMPGCVCTRARVQSGQLRKRRARVTGGESREGAGETAQGFPGPCQNAGFHPEGNEMALEEFEQRSDTICFMKGPL